MINFIYDLFKSEETKIDEEYKQYKAKYGDVVKILKKGDKYAIQYPLSHTINRPFIKNKSVFTTLFYYDLKTAKKYYIDICKGYEFDQLPIVEV